MRVLIAGGSGLLGKAITRALKEKGHEVAWLTRNTSRAAPVPQFEWNPSVRKFSLQAIHWAEAVINLAGESIGEIPWNAEGRKRILKSRLDAVETLRSAYRTAPHALKSFVGVSGAGIYGPGEMPMTETAPFGHDFPAQVAQEWEEAYQRFHAEIPTRHFVILRLAVVLAANGGAFPKIRLPFSIGMGSALGSGNQYLNWIHLEDAAQIFSSALDWDGVFNVSAPEPVRNQELSDFLRQEMGQLLSLPAVPGFALRLALGDRSKLVLEGNRSDISRLLATGYQFRFPEWKPAIRDILKNS